MVTRPDEAGDAQSVDQWHKLKEEGNKLFKDGSHLKAAAAYTTAIKVRHIQGPPLDAAEYKGNIQLCE